MVLLELGIDQKDLKRLTKSEYLSLYPRLKVMSTEIQDKRYKHYELKRKEKIELAKNERKKLLVNNITSVNFYPKKLKDHPFKSSASAKDLETFMNTHRQNIFEIKNIIDFEVNKVNNMAMNELKKENDILSEQNKMRKKLKKIEENIHLNRIREIKKEQYEKKLHKQETQKTMQFFMEEYEKKKQQEKEELLQQKIFLQKQIDDQKKHEDFKNKLEEKNYNKQHKKEIELGELDKKNYLRQQKIEQCKQIKSKEYLMKSQLRELKLSNAKIKNQQLMKDKLNKFNCKQKIIEKHRESSLQKRDNMIYQNKIRQQSQEIKNKNVRGKNEKLLEKKRIELIKKFKENEDKIERQKEINEQKIKEYNYFKSFRRLDADENIKQRQMQISYRNTIKLNNIMYKQKVAEYKQQQKIELCQQKIKLKEYMKDKKNNLINKVHQIIAQGKVRNKDDIYKQIFTKDELKLITNNNCSK